MANEQQNQLQIELTPETATGTYANLAMIAHGNTEFIMDFIAMLPGMQKAQVRSRVIMVPEHAKRLLYALQENISRYEQTFGTIEITQPQAQQGKGRTIAPFGMPGGEA